MKEVNDRDMEGKGNLIAMVGLVFSVAVYGVQDIRRQSSYETKLDALSVWQQEHQKTEASMAVVSQKVDSLNLAVERLTDNMERFLEEIYEVKFRTREDKDVQRPGSK